MTSDAESDFAHEDDSEVIRLGAKYPHILFKCSCYLYLIVHLRLEEYLTSCLWRTSVKSARTSRPSSEPRGVRRTNVTVTQLFELPKCFNIALSSANRVGSMKRCQDELEKHSSRISLTPKQNRTRPLEKSSSRKSKHCPQTYGWRTNHKPTLLPFSRNPFLAKLSHHQKLLQTFHFCRFRILAV